MVDEFILRALVASLILAAMLGPLGAFMVWRRMAYFGDTIAHSALLGVALSLLSGGALPMMGAMFAVAIVVALALTRFARDGRFKADTLLGILAHGTLALGIVLVSINRDMNVDVNAYLFGDILAVGWEEVVVLAGLALVVLGILKHWFRPLLMATLDPDMAQVEGVNVVRAQMVLTLLLAAVIAVAIKLTGVLLITALLIMPAASARYFARTPYAMAIMASLIGMLAAPLGLGASLAIDAPSGPMIVVTAAVMFVLCALIAGKRS